MERGFNRGVLMGNTLNLLLGASLATRTDKLRTIHSDNKTGIILFETSDVLFVDKLRQEMSNYGVEIPRTE